MLGLRPCATPRRSVHVFMLGLVPHHEGVVMLGLVPHHRRRKTSRQCALPLPTSHHHHHHHPPIAHPRAAVVGGAGWGGGEGGWGGHIYCTPPASAHRADGGRSQDLESAPAPNRTGREPAAAASHGLNRCSGDQLSRAEARQVVPRPDAQECALATAKMPEL
jgi:hypothetical protein